MKAEICQLLRPVFGHDVQIQSATAIGGGCINTTSVLTLSNGERVFLKQNARPPQDFFSAEAKGLKYLSKAEQGPRIPQPLAWQDSFLVLEYLAESIPGPEFPIRFAQSLAQLHKVSQSHFGLDHDNYIGSSPQKNILTVNGLDFFREQRLRSQQELARQSGKLSASTDKKLDTLCDRLGDYLDVSGEKPALLHGDLWSGNYFADTDQMPCIFDPAVYFGLREADLAMTELFGRLPQKFYDAYHEAFPLNPGYSERKDLYNLYHLLNHLNLFGGSYLNSVEQVIQKYIQ
jgi:protein-ribulosamine 3-kinase